MKFSKVLLFSLAGAAIIIVAKKIANMKSNISLDDDLIFDTEFIPGSKKFLRDIPEHIDPSWFRAPRYQVEDNDPMFI